MENNNEVREEIKENEVEVETGKAPEIDETSEENLDKTTEECHKDSEEKSEGKTNPLKFLKNLKDENKSLKDENKKLNNEVEALKERLLRITAEYENYRKRTSKEKEGIYTDACTDVLKEMLPVLDNLERALLADGSVDDMKVGIEMTIKGLSASFEKLGVEEIDASGEFDPNIHQAVMHIEDENFEKNSVVEVFQKGYKRGEKVIRYTMVKVAN